VLEQGVAVDVKGSVITIIISLNREKQGRVVGVCKVVISQIQEVVPIVANFIIINIALSSTFYTTASHLLCFDRTRLDLD